MPTQLQIRRGSTTDHNSFTGAAGELTVDTTKDTLRVHDGSTAGGFELARADGSNLNNITSNISFADNVKAQFGAGQDLQIYHDGSNSFIKEGGTGDLVVRASNNMFFQDATGANNYAKFTANAVELRHSNSVKLTTTSTGIDVTGTVTTESLGVGTSSPQGKIHSVASGSLGAGISDFNGVALSVSGSSTSGEGTYGGGIAFQAGSAKRAQIGLVQTGSDTDQQGLAIFTHPSGTYADDLEQVMTIGYGINSNVGIGTSSPVKLLDVSSNSAPTIRISNTRNDSNWDTDPVFGALEFYSADGSGSGAGVRASVKAEASSAFGNATEFVFRNGDAAGVQQENMRIDSSGNVGIGTDSPASLLSVQRNGTVVSSGLDSQTAATFQSTGAAGSSTHVNILAGSAGSSGQAVLTFGDADDPDIGRITYRNGDNSMAFMTNTSEAMRITSGGDLLVGKTTADSLNTGGIEAQTDGQIKSASDGKYPLQLNRLTSDGEIFNLRKDGTTVGSIGTNNDGGSKLFIGNSDSAVKFKTNAIVPCNNVGSNNNDDISLGENGTAFKDLYLSGGAYLGGTASANKLDDYEEGTFTLTTQNDPTGTLTSGGGSYVKIGQQVFIEGAFQVGVNFTNNSVGGLPFTASTATGVGSSVRPIFIFDETGTGKFLRVGNGGSTLQLFDSSGAVDAPDTTGNTYRFMGSYRTSA